MQKKPTVLSDYHNERLFIPKDIQRACVQPGIFCQRIAFGANHNGTNIKRTNFRATAAVKRRNEHDFRPRSDSRGGGHCHRAVQAAEAARCAGLHSCRFSRGSALRLLPHRCRRGQHRLLGRVGNHLPAVLARSGVQFQEIAQRRRLGCGDCACHRGGNDGNRLHCRTDDGLHQHQQSFPRRDAVDVVDNHHHESPRRPQHAPQAVRASSACRADCGRPDSRDSDGAAFLNSNQQQRQRRRALMERHEAVVLPDFMVCGRRLCHTFVPVAPTPVSFRRAYAGALHRTVLPDGNHLHLRRLLRRARSIPHGLHPCRNQRG